MSTLDSSSGDIQDQSQGSYSPHLCPCTPSSASADGLSSTMQTQPHEAPNSHRFCVSSPSPASSHDAPNSSRFRSCSPTPALYYGAPNSPRFCASSPQPASSHDAPKSPCFCATSPDPASSDTAAPTVPPSASPTASPAPEVCSKDATGLAYPTAESYFMRPEVLALMAGSPKEPKLRTSFVSQTTSHHSQLIYQESQIRGLTPRFEIEGNQHKGFGGKVKIGEKTVTTEDRWRSKKAAKEGLAEKALGFVKELPSQKRKRPAAEPKENWIRLLHNHHSPTVATTGGPVYFEYTHGNSFACTCQIPAHPNLFGSESNPVFPSLKAARSNAAKEALQFLIAQGLACSDASFRRGPSKRAKMDAAAAMVEDAEATFAKKVNELCPLLSLPTPEYRLFPSDSSPPNLFSGGAYFPASTPPGLLPTLGPIGSVKDVFGRKAAKDQCAKLVLEFLMEWMKSQDESKMMGKEASGGVGKVGTGGENRDGGLGKKKRD